MEVWLRTNINRNTKIAEKETIFWENTNQSSDALTVDISLLNTKIVIYKHRNAIPQNMAFKAIFIGLPLTRCILGRVHVLTTLEIID